MVDRGSATRPPAAGGADTVRRAFVARGPVDAPVLVLLHGTRRTRAMWRHQLSGLSDTFRVVAVDMPGHGALADVPFRLGDATDLVSAVIDAAGGGRAIVVGQSLGGYVGMDLAARRPDQVAGLVLANATGEPRSIARRAPRTVGAYLLVAASARVRIAGVRGGAGPGGDGDGRTRIPADGDGADGDGADGDGADGPATSGWLFKGGTRALVSALREVFKPRLAAYPGPTLIVNGEDDELFRFSERAFLAAAVDGRLVVIPGCGHEVNEDRPDAFNAVVRDFVHEIHGASVDAGPS
jgi:pimeloyl-ACP methyl ester carboxylesterase